jgi:hypothetical protein
MDDNDTLGSNLLTLFDTDVGNTFERDLLTLPIDACKNELFVLMGRLAEGLLITLILLDETIDYDTKNKLVSEKIKRTLLSMS